MKKIFLFAFLSLVFTGCAMTPKHGDFISKAEISQKSIEILANDAANQVGSLYPPAKTKLTIMQDVKNDFGKVFVEDLRKKGFGISSAKQKKDFTVLYYTLDKLKQEKGFVFLVVDVGDVEISKVFEVKLDSVTSKSGWTRRAL